MAITNRQRVLKLYCNAGSTTNNAATIDVLHDGIIRSVLWTNFGIAGAAIDGRVNSELSLASYGQSIVNDPLMVLSNFSMQFPINTGASAQNLLHAGLSLPVRVGDRIAVHNYLSGTAPGANGLQCLVYVEEQ